MQTGGAGQIIHQNGGKMKIYVTGEGMVTALGRGVDMNVKAIRAGRSGVAMHTGLLRDGDGRELPVMCGMVPEDVMREISEEYPSGNGPYTRLELLAAAALGEALGEAGKKGRIGSRRRKAMIFSSTKGNTGILTAESLDTELPDDVFIDVTAKKTGRIFGYSPEDVYTVSNACISGISALVVARRLIGYGRYDEVAVVGVDVLSEFIVSGFASFRSLSPELCRPYDRERCGLNLGEAAGAVVLASGPEYMPSCAVISGGSISDDANHISGPSRTGDALYFAMRDAMEEAGTSPSDVSFVSLHGTATVYNDEMESKAVSLAGLSGTPVQSLKPYIGHTLGASGVVESILCIRQLLSGEVWGTPGYNESGVPLPLDVSDCTRQVAMRHCVKTASGFGGCNAAAVFSLPEYAPDTCIGKPAGYAVIRHVRLDGQSLFHASSGAGDFHSAIREKYRSMGLDDMKFYKMDDMSKLGYIAGHMLLEGLQFAPEEMAVILQNRNASLDSDLKHLSNITRGAGASPSVFVYTLPNVASGEISIRHRIKGENTFFISDRYSKVKMEDYAAMVLSSSHAKYCIVGWLDFLRGTFLADFELLEKTSDSPQEVSGNRREGEL